METPLSQFPEYTIEQATQYLAALKGDILMLDEAIEHLKKTRESTLVRIGLYSTEIERSRKETKVLEDQWSMEAIEQP